MSAADKFLNKRPFMGHLITFVSMLIIAFTSQALSSKNVVNKDLKDKVDGNTINLESKADKTYVHSYVSEEINEAIAEHEKVDAARYNGISEMFNVIREEQAEMRQDIKEILKNQK